MKAKKNKRLGLAIYQFPYYKSDGSFLRVFLTKALFACILSFSGAGLFSVLLEIKLNPIGPALAATLACLITFVLLGFFRKLYVALFELAGLVVYWLNVPMLQLGQDFLRQVFEVSDGTLIKTSGLIAPSDANDPFSFFILICVLFGVLCAFSSSRRFHPIAVLTFAEIMLIPAFLGQSLHFSWWLTVMIASVVGMWGTTMASSADVSLSSGKASNLHMSDYVYLKANKKLTPVQRIRSESLHFGRHLSDCAALFVIVLLTLGITASSFPQEGSLKIENLVLEAKNLSQSVSYWIADIFGSSGMQGFFSADGGNISISGNVNPDDWPTGNRPVAEIITETKDKIYLRGDVAYAYKDEQWETISRLDYDGISYGKRMSDVLGSYSPEVQLYVARYLASRAFFEGPDAVKLQTVKVNYLQNINTLLIGGTPCVYNFRENDNFSIYGDFVSIADRGSVNSMKLALLYFNETLRDELLPHMTSDTYYSDGDVQIMWNLVPVPMSYEDYEEYIDTYNYFVYDHYTDVPEEERENIKGFLDEAFGEGFSDSIVITEDGVLMNPAVSYQPPRSFYASSLESYLTSGLYKYSLDTDNSAGDNTFLGNFLFDTRAGHCALYATTMCLALRYMGIPARYVTGFTVGGNDCEKTDEGYSYTVLERDLHAWVEVYYEGVGWVPYDPTPGSAGYGGDTSTTTSTTTPATTTTTSRTSITTTPPPSTTSTSRPPVTTTSATTAVPSGGSEVPGETQQFDPEMLKLILIIAGSAVIVLATALSIAGAVRRLKRREMECILFFRTGDSVKAVRAMLPFMLKLLELKKVHRHGGETPAEFAKRVDDIWDIELMRAMPLFERAEFDGSPSFNEMEHKTVYDCVSKLYGELMEDIKGSKRFFTKRKLFKGVKLEGKEK